MMTEYITNLGYSMLSRMLSGECKIDFTRVEMGNGVPSESDLKKMTKLSKKVCSIDVESVRIETDNTVDITASFTNAEITEAFYFKEKGVFASDGTNEILFSYAYTADPELIPTNKEGFLEKRLKSIMKQLQDTTSEINIQIKVGNYVTSEEYISDKKETDEEINNIIIDISKLKESTYTKQEVDTKITELENSIDTDIEILETQFSNAVATCAKGAGLELGVTDNGILTVTYDDGTEG